jgi:peptidoglycan/xylan/chitin deacetylase (PgdA/CDA1 family)
MPEPPFERVLTLTFHGIGSPGRPLADDEAKCWLAPEAFLRMLDAIPSDGSVEITFDDGNRSDVTLGLPALLDRGLKATFFVLAGQLGAPGGLAAADLRRLQADGMEIGSHGMRHRSWRRLDERSAREEIVDAKARLEDLTGRPVVKAACPFGSYDRAALRRLREAGFRAVYTSDGGARRTGRWLRARRTVETSDPPSIVAGLLSGQGRALSELVRDAKQVIKRLR